MSFEIDFVQFESTSKTHPTAAPVSFESRSQVFGPNPDTQTESEIETPWETLRPSQSISQVATRIPRPPIALAQENGQSLSVYQSTNPPIVPSGSRLRMGDPRHILQPSDDTQTQSETEITYHTLRPSQSVSQNMHRTLSKPPPNPDRSDRPCASHLTSASVPLGQRSMAPTIDHYEVPNTQTESEISSFFSVRPSQSVSQVPARSTAGNRPAPAFSLNANSSEYPSRDTACGSPQRPAPAFGPGTTASASVTRFSQPPVSLVRNPSLASTSDFDSFANQCNSWEGDSIELRSVSQEHAAEFSRRHPTPTRMSPTIGGST
jgi:hypothetical protein